MRQKRCSEVRLDAEVTKRWDGGRDVNEDRGPGAVVLRQEVGGGGCCRAKQWSSRRPLMSLQLGETSGLEI